MTNPTEPTTSKLDQLVERLEGIAHGEIWALQTPISVTARQAADEIQINRAERNYWRERAQSAEASLARMTEERNEIAAYLDRCDAPTVDDGNAPLSLLGRITAEHDEWEAAALGADKAAREWQAQADAGGERQGPSVADISGDGPRAASADAGPSACKTPGTRYSTAMPTATSIQVTLRFPFVISDWALGNSAVTEGSKLQRYAQMFAERKRVDDLIHDQMEVVGADAYRVMGFDLAAAEWNADIEGRPFTAKDWGRLTLGEQTDYLLRTRTLTASTASPADRSVRPREAALADAGGERLRAALEALEPFARAADKFQGSDDALFSGFTLRDFRRASLALSGGTEKQGLSSSVARVDMTQEGASVETEGL